MTTPHIAASADVDPASDTSGASAHSSSRALPSSLARLPADLQASLIQIRNAGRGLFGHRDTQSIFDDNLATLERLYQIGASHSDVSQVLHDIGIARGDGESLSAGTVSSAMSRARRSAARNGRRPGGRRRAPSVRVSVSTGAAQRSAALHDSAGLSEAASGGGRPYHTLALTERPDPPKRRGETDLRGGRSDSSDGSSHPVRAAAPDIDAPFSSALARASPGEDPHSTRSRLAGRLLNQLRNDDDEI